MKPENYLNNLFQKIPSYQITDEEKKKIKFEGIETYIFSKLNSTKFKASSIDPTLVEKIKTKIHLAVSQNNPIHISVPFGGYKKWQLPSFPTPDLAEVYCLLQLREYLTPITSVYKPGVFLEYFSDEIFVARMNNYSQEELDCYNNEFAEILEYFKVYFPNNFKIKLSKIRDQISQDKLMERFDVIIEDLKIKWKTLSEEEKAFRLEKTKRNYKADLKGLSSSEKEKTLMESTFVHDAFIFGDWDYDTPWAFDTDMIPLGFRYTGKWGIHVKSSKSSTVQFWIGVGVLLKKEHNFIPTILTYKQFLEKKNAIKKIEINTFSDSLAHLNHVFILE